MPIRASIFIIIVLLLGGVGEARAQNVPTILILGDSLTEGYGVPADQAYPHLLEQSLQKKGYRVKIINGGESGSTSAGGLSRLNWYLRSKPDMVIVALGANDGLRGLALSAMQANLTAIITQSQKAGAKVMIAGMQIPPNYGREYTEKFAQSYPQIAQQFNIPLIPFLLEGVGGVRNKMQADGLHPNIEGQAIIAKTVEKALLKHFPSFLRPSA